MDSDDDNLQQHKYEFSFIKDLENSTLFYVTGLAKIEKDEVIELIREQVVGKFKVSQLQPHTCMIDLQNPKDAQKVYNFLKYKPYKTEEIVIYPKDGLKYYEETARIHIYTKEAYSLKEIHNHFESVVAPVSFVKKDKSGFFVQYYTVEQCKEAYEKLNYNPFGDTEEPLSLGLEKNDFKKLKKQEKEGGQPVSTSSPAPTVTSTKMTSKPTSAPTKERVAHGNQFTLILEKVKGSVSKEDLHRSLEKYGEILDIKSKIGENVYDEEEEEKVETKIFKVAFKEKAAREEAMKKAPTLISFKKLFLNLKPEIRRQEDEIANSVASERKDDEEEESEGENDDEESQEEESEKSQDLRGDSEDEEKNGDEEDSEGGKGHSNANCPVIQKIAERLENRLDQVVKNDKLKDLLREKLNDLDVDDSLDLVENKGEWLVNFLKLIVKT